jgi:hypothetical protein
MKQSVSDAIAQFLRDHTRNFDFGFAGPVLVVGLGAKIDVLPVLSLEKRHV